MGGVKGSASVGDRGTVLPEVRAGGRQTGQAVVAASHRRARCSYLGAPHLYLVAVVSGLALPGLGLACSDPRRVCTAYRMWLLTSGSSTPRRLMLPPSVCRADRSCSDRSRESDALSNRLCIVSAKMFKEQVIHVQQLRAPNRLG